MGWCWCGVWIMGRSFVSLRLVMLFMRCVFCRNEFWLCAATHESIRIWYLETKEIVKDLKVSLNTDDDWNGSTTDNKRMLFIARV
ncbi:hypothetical protein GLYMA_09G177976v4 [Glycine max]|nr:hypothetical protein GLYMA_09G177976v4 [Glycine max]